MKKIETTNPAILISVASVLACFLCAGSTCFGLGLGYTVGQASKGRLAQAATPITYLSAKNEPTAVLALEQPVKDTQPTEVPATEAPAAPAPAPATSNVTYAEIRDNMTAMTDIQWDEYVKTLEGVRIEWQGWVEEVKASGSDQVQVMIDMDAPTETMSVQDLYIYLPLDQGKSLKKDQPITFVGTISSVLNLFGVCSINIDNAVMK
jgi:hypothetical protein